MRQMRLTLEEHIGFVQDPEYSRLPEIIAGTDGAGQRGGGVARIGQRAKMSVWDGTQSVALLFDTYGGHIKSINLGFSVAYERCEMYSLDQMYMICSVYINEGKCIPGSYDIGEKALEGCGQADNLRAMGFAIRSLERLSGHYPLGEIGFLEGHLNASFESAAQAREVGRLAAPEIHAWFKSKLLLKQLEGRVDGRHCQPGM